VQKEIVSHSQHISQLEDSILEAMGRSEEAQRASEAENARARQAQEALDAQERSLQTDFETAKAGIPAAIAAREAMLGTMEARLRAAYDRILRNKGDAGLAIVNAQSCGICKGVQPPQVLQALRAGIAMQNCQNCGRILVWDPAAA
jgi:hypothetical protein